MSDRQRNVLILTLVVGLVLASLLVVAGIPGAVNAKKTELGLDLKGGVQLVYKGEPSAQTPHVTQAALQRAVDTMNQRVDQLGVSEPQISTYGCCYISASLPDVQKDRKSTRLNSSHSSISYAV